LAQRGRGHESKDGGSPETPARPTGEATADHEHLAAAVESRTAEPKSPAFGRVVRDIQRRAGNQATGSLVNLWGRPTPVQRHSVRDAPPVADEDELQNGTPVQRWKDGVMPTGPKPSGMKTTPRPAPSPTWKKTAPTPGVKGPDGAKALDPAAALSAEDKSAVADLVKWGLDQRSAIAKLSDTEFTGAVIDYWKFVAAGPYAHLDYQTDDKFGKFDATYDAASKRLDITMRIKFAFPDDTAKVGETPEDEAKREERHNRYVTNFLGHVGSKWSGKFSFQNVRSPAAVWGKLNPVAVNVKVDKTDANQHFLAKIYMTKEDTANVTNSQVLSLFKGDDVINEAFVKGTIAGEQKRIKKIAPTVGFDYNGTELSARGKTSLDFFAKYLSRLSMPKVEVKLTGRSTDLAYADKRVKIVKDALGAGGLGAPHTVTSKARRELGRNVVVEGVVDQTFRNVQDVQAHEFGHMLGLDDEYEVGGNKGKGIETYGLTKEALGKDYADLRARAGTDSASVMDGGSDVRVEHYITLWQVLGRITTAKAAVPAAKFGSADWKFNQ
jgi:hypothetical protein